MHYVLFLYILRLAIDKNLGAIMQIVEGYGLKDLVHAVRQTKWTPCSPNGEHFMGIDFKGNLLVSDPDIIFPQKYRAIFHEIPRGSGDEFILEGFQMENLLDYLKLKQNIPISFGDSSFVLESNNNIYSIAYRLLLDKI